MRPRDRILANLETLYRDSYERARAVGDSGRMRDLDNAYVRDQLMMEVLLDIRDLFAAPVGAGGALQRVEAIRRLGRRR